MFLLNNLGRYYVVLIENTEETSRKALCDLLAITPNHFQKLKEAGVFQPNFHAVM